MAQQIVAFYDSRTFLDILGGPVKARNLLLGKLWYGSGIHMAWQISLLVVDTGTTRDAKAAGSKFEPQPRGCRPSMQARNTTQIFF